MLWLHCDCAPWLRCVTALPQAYFSTVVKDADADLVQHVVNVMLERMRLLYSVSEAFTAEIGKAMAKNCLLLFEKAPQLIVDLRKELVEFVSDRNNVVDGREVCA